MIRPVSGRRNACESARASPPAASNAVNASASMGGGPADPGPPDPSG